MKRIVVGILALMLIIGLSGCTEEQSPVKVSAKILVAQNMFGGTARVPIVEVTSIVDSVVIKNVIANNGNCPMTSVRQKEFPQTVKYGQKATAGYITKCNLLKVKVVTDQGDWEFEFDYIPEQHVQM